MWWIWNQLMSWYSKHYVLQRCHNKRDGFSNHQHFLFRHWSRKTWMLRVTDICEGNSPVTGEFPVQRASNAENVSWRAKWHHHGLWDVAMLFRMLRFFIWSPWPLHRGSCLFITYQWLRWEINEQTHCLLSTYLWVKKSELASAHVIS